MAEESRSLKWGRWAQAESERTFSELYSSIYRTLESSLSTLCDNGDKGTEQRNVKVTYAPLSLAKNRKYACGKHATSP